MFLRGGQGASRPREELVAEVREAGPTLEVPASERSKQRIQALRGISWLVRIALLFGRRSVFANGLPEGFVDFSFQADRQLSFRVGRLKEEVMVAGSAVLVEVGLRLGCCTLELDTF